MIYIEYTHIEKVWGEVTSWWISHMESLEAASCMAARTIAGIAAPPAETVVAAAAAASNSVPIGAR